MSDIDTPQFCINCSCALCRAAVASVFEGFDGADERIKCEGCHRKAREGYRFCNRCRKGQRMRQEYNRSLLGDSADV